MASVHHALYNCCGTLNPCCTTITAVWYLCLAIVIMVIFISCNDVLKSQCYLIGFPWSKSKWHYHETVVDEEVELLIVFNSDPDDMEQESTDFVSWPPPPPPYSAVEHPQTLQTETH